MIYGFQDYIYIEEELYTKDKHEKFEKVYGTLISGFNLRKLGKNTAILIPFVLMVK